MMRVEVYRNLSKGCWSIRHKGRVIVHESRLILRDCTMHVQPAGRERVRRERRKNVHAYVKGIWGGPETHIKGPSPKFNLYYNPYDHDSFMWNGLPIYNAALVEFTERGAFVS